MHQIGLELRTQLPPLEFTPMEDFGNRFFVGLSHYFQIIQLWQILVLKGNSKLQQANYVKPNEVTQKHHEHTNTHKSDEASSSQLMFASFIMFGFPFS